MTSSSSSRSRLAHARIQDRQSFGKVVLTCD